MIGEQLVVDDGGNLSNVGDSLTESSSGTVFNSLVVLVVSTVFNNSFITPFSPALSLYLICMSIRNKA